jgi:hypothetical protein
MLDRDALLAYRNKLFEADNERFAEFMAIEGVWRTRTHRSLRFDEYVLYTTVDSWYLLTRVTENFAKICCGNQQDRNTDVVTIH